MIPCRLVVALVADVLGDGLFKQVDYHGVQYLGDTSSKLNMLFLIIWNILVDREVTT